MPENIRIITARRAYEFRADDLNLAWIATPLVKQGIQEAFHFTSAAISVPMPTFGAPTPALPPGVVFDNGFHQDGDFVAGIRFIHFEPNRIVIDVASDSAWLDNIYARLSQVIGGLDASSGHQPAPTPERVRDYSELSAQCLFDAFSLLPDGMDMSMLDVDHEQRTRSATCPCIVVQFQDASEPFPGLVIGDHSAYQLALRAGTNPEDRLYFSAGPMSTENNRAFLSKLEDRLPTRMP